MELIKETTIIGTKNVRNDNGEEITVNVIYNGEESGLLVDPTGKWNKKSWSADGYRIMLEQYKHTNQADDLITEESGTDDIGRRTPEEPESDGDEETPVDGEDKKRRKKFLIPVIIVAALAVILLGLTMAHQFMQPKEVPKQVISAEEETTTEPDYTNAVHVAVMLHTVNVGDIVTPEDFTDAYISRDTYEMLRKTTYIDGSGTTRLGTVIRWDDISDYSNAVALRMIESNTVAMADDFTVNRNDITGSTKIRLVAVLSSDSLESDVVVELGSYVVNAGSLSDILSAQGDSVRDLLYSEAETMVYEQEDNGSESTVKDEAEVKPDEPEQ